MNKTFAFRQRAGHLNWKLISSIDIFRIVDELRIDELQSVLDPIAFCEFSVSDVKRNTVDATTKLVHLMQLMIEYLLYCQEAQLLLLKDMDGQNRALRKDIKLCTRDNMSFREDIKIYKRQLALLKQALNQGGDGGDQITYRMINPPVSPEQLKPILEPICAMIESVHRHERETREYMRAALEQRPPQTATPSRDEDMSSLQQMQNAIVIARNEAKAEAKLRELELRAREKELEAREKELEAREKEQQRREGELAEALRRPPTAVVTTDSGNIKKWNVHFVAMNFLHTTLKSSMIVCQPVIVL